MAMKDLGISQKHHMATESPNTEHKSYPSTTIDHKSLPHMKKHQVGDTGTMQVKYKVTGQRSHRNGDGSTDVDITHASPVKQENEKQMAKDVASDEAKESTKEKK